MRFKLRDWAGMMTFVVTIWGGGALSCDLRFFTFSCSFCFLFFNVRKGEDKNNVCSDDLGVV